MKIFYIFVALISFCQPCKSQKRTDIPEEWKKEFPHFVNQGEFEDYSAWQFFKKEYKRENVERYKGVITRDENLFTFGLDKINVNYYETNLDSLFSSGLLYPTLFKNGFMPPTGVTDIEELVFLNTSNQIKRFRLWLFYGNMANPQVYLFELENTSATSTTSMSDFIKGANLTFIKGGWIII